MTRLEGILDALSSFTMTNPICEKSLEHAARYLCKLRGQDPDESKTLFGDIPVWLDVAEEIRAAHDMKMALTEYELKKGGFV